MCILECHGPYFDIRYSPRAPAHAQHTHTSSFAPFPTWTHIRPLTNPRTTSSWTIIVTHPTNNTVDCEIRLEIFFLLMISCTPFGSMEHTVYSSLVGKLSYLIVTLGVSQGFSISYARRLTLSNIRGQDNPRVEVCSIWTVGNSAHISSASKRSRSGTVTVTKV